MLSGHAHIIAATEKNFGAVLRLLQAEGIHTADNPDLYIRSYKQFGIDEARGLSERAAMRPLAKQRVFVLTVDSITAEAQNALLKTLEEPAAGALFIFIHPAPHTLLSTVLSRVQVIRLEAAGVAPAAIDPAIFLKADRLKRLDLLKPLLEKGDDERRDVGAVVTFLVALETALAEGKNIRALYAVYRARRYIGDRGALVKPLMEQVALLV